MRKLVPLLLVLAGCSGGGSPPLSPPAPPRPAQVSLDPSAWSLVYSLGSQITTSQGAAFQFWFPANSSACPEPTETTTPTCPSVHYVETLSPPLAQGQTITWVGSVVTSPDAVFNYGIDADNTAPGGHPPACRVWFEQAGDQALTQPYYRWWSIDPADLVLQEGSYAYAIHVALNPALWSSVNGENGANSAAATTGFQQALANVQNIGFTCGGGSFYGHGVNMTAGSAALIVTGFSVQ